MTDTTDQIAKLREMQDDGYDFQAQSGAVLPDRIWLVHMASSDTSWAAEPDPEGEGEPSVAYVRVATALPIIDALVAEVERQRGLRDQYREAWEAEKLRFTAAMAALNGGDNER